MAALLGWLVQETTLLYSLLFSLPFFLLFVLFKFNRTSTRKLNLPPSPPKLPLIGNLHQLGLLPHHALRALSHKHGPLMIIYLGQFPTLIVSSAEMVREIMKTNDLAFASRPDSKMVRTLFYDCKDVAFAPYGDYWRQMRKICMVELLSAKKVQSFRFVREEEVSLMVEKIRGSSPNHPINMNEMLFNLTNNIVCRVSLGRKYESVDGKNPLLELQNELMELLGIFHVGDFVPSLGWIDGVTGLTSRMKKNFKGFDAFLDQVVEEHLCRKADDHSDRADFVDVLLRVQKEQKLDVPISRDNLKAMILDIFAAGTDTSSTTLEWAMAELIKKPNEMKKVQEEVRRVCGKNAKVEEEDLQQMKYLKLVIMETLRLHPPATLLPPRESITDVKIQGYDIPAKTRVLINAWAIGRDPKSWENPDEFLPERFIGNPIDFRGQDFQFVPFGGGRRGCPGLTFGVMAMELILANLLYWFDWELPCGAKMEDLDMSEGSGFSVRKKFSLQLVPNNYFS